MGGCGTAQAPPRETKTMERRDKLGGQWVIMELEFCGVLSSRNYDKNIIAHLLRKVSLFSAPIARPWSCGVVLATGIMFTVAS